MLVTRTETAKIGQKHPHGEVFCDWLSIYQEHPAGGLPVINDGYVVKFGADALREWIDPETGEVVRAVFDATKAEFTTQRKIEHEGSYESRLSIRCDGYRVELSGNVGRFDRPDNLFGLGVVETVEKASRIVSALGLPWFSDVDATAGLAHSQTHLRTNAVITRVDLTQNYATGSKEAAYKVIQSMAGTPTARGGVMPKAYPHGLTWNEGSRRHYQKLYYKAESLGQWASPDVVEYCRNNGIVRFEVSIKARELADRGLQSVTAWARHEKGQKMENVIFGHFAKVLDREQVSMAEIHGIPGKLGMVAQAYLDGRDPYRTSGAADKTRRTWRKQLRAFGIDIAAPMNVQHLARTVRTVELVPVHAPDWYQVAA
ncbi:MAG: phage/plasmid replication protein [Rhodocyclaceae bacterium]|nr:phage/plasmid replication protein [Rhodocyclaceae bacterium]